jgi:hypothetical protein
MDVKSRVVARWIGRLCLSACLGSTLLGACSTGVPASPRFEERAAADAIAPSDVEVSVACPDAGYPTCPSPPPSWKMQVQPIVDTSCSPCHFNGGSGTGNGFDYSTRPDNCSHGRARVCDAADGRASLAAGRLGDAPRMAKLRSAQQLS